MDALQQLCQRIAQNNEVPIENAELFIRINTEGLVFDHLSDLEEKLQRYGHLLVKTLLKAINEGYAPTSYYNHSYDYH